MTIVLAVAKEFSVTPGPRRRDEGDHSGQEFLETELRPRFLEAQQRQVKLLIDLDGTEGYATSFLEESFGGLAREFGPNLVLEILEFKTEEEPYLIDEIRNYIREATEGT